MNNKELHTPFLFCVENESNENKQVVLFGADKNSHLINFGSDEGVKIIAGRYDKEGDINSEIIYDVPYVNELLRSVKGGVETSLIRIWVKKSPYPYNQLHQILSFHTLNEEYDRITIPLITQSYTSLPLHLERTPLQDIPFSISLNTDVEISFSIFKKTKIHISFYLQKDTNNNYLQKAFQNSNKHLHVK